MTDVYRQPGRGCPACGGAKLREFGERIVCDDCAGMLIGETDFTTAIRELDGKETAINVSDAQPSEQPCPRCTRALESVAISVGKHRVDERVLRCAKDGLWIPQALMTAVFARASRTSKAGAQRGFDPARAASFAGANMGSALRSVANAFQPAAGRLAVSRWKTEKPTVHTLYVSAFKDRQLGCPACDGVALDYRGDRWDCETCHGAFVEPAALAAMVSEITNKPWTLPAMSGPPGDRHCPVCQDKLVMEHVEHIAIDRCAAHGVWFDDHELERALHNAAVDEPKSIGGWLRKLFGRSQVAI